MKFAGHIATSRDYMGYKKGSRMILVGITTFQNVEHVLAYPSAARSIPSQIPEQFRGVLNDTFPTDCNINSFSSSLFG